MLIHQLVYKRIDFSEAGMALVDRGWRIDQKLINQGARVATKPLPVESLEENRLKLEAYGWVVGTIENMGANEMFRLIARLKTPNKLLIDILKSIPRSKEYVIRTRDGKKLRYKKLFSPDIRRAS